MLHRFSIRLGGKGHGETRPGWERELPVGKPVFDLSLRTAGELVAAPEASRCEVDSGSRVA